MIMRAALFLMAILAAGPAMAEALPLPPVPPAQVPGARAAPVPDPDAIFGLPAETQQTSVEIRNFQPPSYTPGMAFTPGSRFRTPEERRPIQTPGLSLVVPLE